MTARPAAILDALDRDDLAAGDCAQLEALLKIVSPTPLARAAALWVRKREWEREHPEGRRGGDRRSKQFRTAENQTANFAVWSAQRLGLAERTVRDDVQLAEELGVDAIKTLWETRVADNAAHLKIVANLHPPQRARLFGQIKANPDASFAEWLRDADLRPEADSDEALFRSLVAGWARANTKVRRRFLAHIGQASSKAT